MRRTFPLVLSPLLQHRRYCAWILGTVAVHVGLSALKWPGAVCPFRVATGLRCPFCGLTAATLDLLRGEFSQSVVAHAFAPLFVFIFSALVVLTVAPAPSRASALRRVATIEASAPAFPILAVALTAYWVVRCF